MGPAILPFFSKIVAPRPCPYRPLGRRPSNHLFSAKVNQLENVTPTLDQSESENVIFVFSYLGKIHNSMVELLQQIGSVGGHNTFRVLRDVCTGCIPSRRGTLLKYNYHPSFVLTRFLHRLGISTPNSSAKTPNKIQ